MNEYRSQFGEDRVLQSIFYGLRDGVCVEVGANDGINDSNSYFFEKAGWTCVLVEPNPDLCQLIRRSRNALLHECAASDHAGETILHIAEGAARSHGVSTVSEDPEVLSRIRLFGFTTRPVRVTKRTLDELLVESGVPRNFEFITIDVEGHELEVLRGFDLMRWRPQILIVENNSKLLDFEMDALLSASGYFPFLRTEVNYWYKPAESHGSATFGLRFYVSLAIVRIQSVPRLIRNLRFYRALRAATWKRRSGSTP